MSFRAPPMSTNEIHLPSLLLFTANPVETNDSFYCTRKVTLIHADICVFVNRLVYHLQALVILFAILRKIAWDYGRIALVNRKEER